MKKNKVIINYLYNMIYQVVNIIIPVITIPYISNVLGAEGIGINGYTYSFAAFFAGIGIFGITNYGSKKIAYVRASKEGISNTFWSIWSLQALASLACTIVYILLFILNDFNNLRLMFLMQFPLLLAAFLDISWLFIGLEDFKKTVIRNILVKVIGLILIFVFVKGKDALGIYVIINSMIACLGNLTFWLFLFKYVNKPNLKRIKVKPHFLGALFLLIPQLAIQIYTTMDRSIIGSLSNMVEVGYYDNSQKIARLALVFVTSLSFVMMPRIANMYANNNEGKVNEILGKSLKFTLLVSIFISSCLISVAGDFVPSFFGEEFNVITPYMMLSSVIVVFISIGGVFANQYSLPTGRSKEYAVPLILAAIVNPMINILLVPSLRALGGVIAIVITEFLVMCMRVWFVRNQLDLKRLFNGLGKYITAGIISCIATLLISNYLSSNLLSAIIEGGVNALIYIALIILLDKEIRMGFSQVIKRFILK